MNNQAIVQQAYQDFGQGNIPGVLAVFDDNIKWMGATGFPFYDGESVVVGPQNILQKVFARIPEFFDDFGIEIQQIYESDQTVIVESLFSGTWKASGNAFKANGVTIWDLKDGKVQRAFEAVDTGAIMK